MFLLKADQMKRYEKEKVGVPFSLFLTLYASGCHITLERVATSDETEEMFPYRGIPIFLTLGLMFIYLDV